MSDTPLHNNTDATPSSSPEPVVLSQAERLVEDLLNRTNALIANVGNTSHHKLQQQANNKSSKSSKHKGALGPRRLSIDGDDDLSDGYDDDGVAPSIMLVQPRLITGGTLRQYQLEGLNWLIRLFETRISGILADEMGLGKTLQTISMLAYLKEYYPIQGPHLILTPLSTLGNWAREFERFAPSINVIKFHGNKDERSEMKLNIGEFDVFLTSYEMAMKEKSMLNKYKWQYIIIDEAHRLKNENSILSQIVRMFSSEIRLLLTGTPLQNNLHELWALLNFLVPDIFSDSAQFDEMFSSAEANDNVSNNVLQQLHKILRPFMLRRLKSQVATDLPPKKEVLVFVGMSELQHRVYKGVLLRDIDAVQGNVKERSRLMNIVMQLRKAANHPYLFEGVEDRTLNPYDTHLYINSGKMQVLDKLLHRLQTGGHRVLIFSQMTKMIDILEDYAIYRQFQYCRIDGSTTQPDREVQMKAFNEPGSEKFLFLLSTRAGGLGINLWTADTVILYDSDWNPQMDLQAQDRAHRIGQTKQVNVYRFVTESTIEEKIIERAEIKLRLDRMVINRSSAQAKSAMSTDDMTNMIRFGADRVFRQLGSTITDDDIDNILQRGEQKTQQLAEKLKSQAATIADLTFDATAPVKLVEDTTVDIPSDLIGLALEEQTAALGRRKAAQSSTTIYRDTLTSTKLTAPRLTIHKPIKIPKMFEHQFYNISRIQELAQKESDFYDQYQFSSNPPAMRGISESEEQELIDLLADGFVDWTWTDYHRFLKACRRYGKQNINKIAQYVGKSISDVQKYHTHLFNNMESLKNYKSIQEKLAHGEARVARFSEFQQQLDQALQQYETRDDVINKLQLRYAQMHKGMYNTSIIQYVLLSLIELLTMIV